MNLPRHILAVAVIAAALIEARAENPAPVHAVFLIAEDEYDAARTLPEFANDELRDRLGWRCTYVVENPERTLSGIDALDTADLMTVFVRRRPLPPEQLDRIKAYCESGKPVVGLRTASHAFAVKSDAVPERLAEWRAFDAEILGGHYTGHTNNNAPGSPRTLVREIPEMASHIILEGVAPEFESRAWMYKVSPLSASAQPLLIGSVPGYEREEPIAWTNTARFGNRVFYTSLGHPQDFENPVFRKLLRNGMLWAATGNQPEMEPESTR